MSAEPAAGGNARAEAERRAELRLLWDIEMWGGLGLERRAEPEHSREPARRKGAEGEELTAKRLEKHLRGSDVAVMHDLLIPGTHANIDHVCVGPGGVTVIASKSFKGKAEVSRGKLWINGREQIRLIDALHRQIEVVRMVLAEAQIHWAGVEGALSMTNLDGLALPAGIRVDGILIDGPRGVAKRAKRQTRGQAIDADLVRAVIGAELGRRTDEP